MFDVLGITPARADEINSASLTASIADINGWSFKRSDGSEVAIRGRFATKLVSELRSAGSPSYKVAHPHWRLPFVKNQRVTAPPSDITSTPKRCAWSPDGRILAITLSASPYLKLYSLRDKELRVFNGVPFNSNQAQNVMVWSPSGKYAAVGSGSGTKPHIYIFDLNIITLMSNSTSFSQATDFSWTPDDGYLAQVRSVSPFVEVIKLTPPNVLSKLANPAILPPGNSTSVAWSPDGVYLVVGSSVAPYLAIYKRTGDTLAKLDNPTTNPTGAVTRVVWNPNNTQFAVAHTNAPYLSVYKRVDDQINKLPDVDVIPGGNATAVDWSPDSLRLAVAHSGSAGVDTYVRNGDAFVKEPPFHDSDLGAGIDLRWSPDGGSLAILHSAGPKFSLYLAAGKQYGGIPIEAKDVP